MRLRGFSLWNKSISLTDQAKAHSAHGVKAVYVSGQDDRKLDERSNLLKSLRPGEGVGVYALNCLATDRDDLRWALVGVDANTRYKGIFARGHFVYVYELEAKITDMQTIEAVLSAVENWAGEARKRTRSEDVRYGSLGGRPVHKRLAKKLARPIWHGPGTVPERLAAVNALAREHGVKGYTRPAAFRHLGPLKRSRVKPTETCED